MRKQIKHKQNLNKRLREKNKAIHHKEKTIDTVPVFDVKGRIITAEKKKRQKKRNICIAVITAVLCFIYIPGYFSHDTPDSWTNVSLDEKAIKYSDDYLKNHPNDDFDNDGILNSEEIAKQTNPWDMDTDKDHLTDQCELNYSKTDPLTSDSSLIISTQKKLDALKKRNIQSPYKINNVILYADSYSSKALGSVIETTKGYHFCAFSGYAHFPEKGYAYRVKNGIHSLMEYHEKEDVWKIEKEDFVEIYQKKLPEIVEFSFFGKKIYGTSTLPTRILAKILPDKGYITAQIKMKIDVEPDIEGAKEIKVESPVYEDDSNFRFGTNNISTNDYLFVKDNIDKGICVACSIFRPDGGEYIGIIYGYDANGNFLIADQDSLKKIGTIKMIPTSYKYLNESGDIVTISYMEFCSKDFGPQSYLSSYNGDRISFFAASTGNTTSPSLSEMEKNIQENSPEQSSTEQIPVEQTEEVLPEQNSTNP